MESIGIQSDHIFSSRNADFERQILDITSNHGVDVILNSLSGELLEASWNIIVFGGTMIEIGNNNIYDHSRLPMEPFKRSASFRALNLNIFLQDVELVSRYSSSPIRFNLLFANLTQT